MKQTSRISWSRCDPGIASEHPQLALIRSEAEDRVERGGLAGAVRADEAEDAAFFDAQIDAVQRDVVPYVLRRPRASMQAMASALLLVVFDGRPRAAALSAVPLGSGRAARMVAWILGHSSARNFSRSAFSNSSRAPAVDEHAQAALLLDELLVDELLVGLQHRERIDPIFGGDVAHRGQRIAFLEHAVEDHRDDTIAQLAVDRLAVVPFTIHPVFRVALTSDMRGAAGLGFSYSVIVDYNTTSRASIFFDFFSTPVLPVPELIVRRYRNPAYKEERQRSALPDCLDWSLVFRKPHCPTGKTKAGVVWPEELDAARFIALTNTARAHSEPDGQLTSCLIGRLRIRGVGSK